jgi:acetyl esterase
MTDPAAFEGQIAREWRRFPPPEVDLVDVAHARSAFSDHFRKVASRSTPRGADLAVEDIPVPSLTDDHAVAARVYRPTGSVNGAALVYMHGGAFVMGDLDFEDMRCRSLAHESGCTLVSVDYRLAPEHRHPVPLEDCYSALTWVAENATELAIDPARLGVGGCSAGGALAAGLAMLARDRGGPALVFQLLVYPVLDASMSARSLKTLLSEDELDTVERMWGHYLNGPRDEAPQYASPARRRDLAGLPPTYIAAAELDYLRDEAIAYAQALLDAGVTVELHLWPRVPHAFDQFAPDATIARNSVTEQADAIARFLGSS